MIANIRDHRKFVDRWKCVNAVLENTHHDNGCKDADQADTNVTHDLTFDERKDISLADALAWGMAEKATVTLFLYDKGEGIG